MPTQYRVPGGKFYYNPIRTPNFLLNQAYNLALGYLRENKQLDDATIKQMIEAIKDSFGKPFSLLHDGNLKEAAVLCGGLALNWLCNELLL